MPWRSSPARKRSFRPARASGSAPSRRCPPISMSRFLAIDEMQLAADFERGHIFTDRLLHRRGRDETMLLGAATMRPIIEKLAARHQLRLAAALLQAHLCRTEEAVAPAAALRHRRLLGRHGLCGGRTHPPPARRCRRRARRALAAHPQCPGRALSVGRRRLHRRHRCHRHGPQHGCRSCRLRRDPQVRRLPLPQPNPAELGQVAGRAGRYLNDGTFGVTGEADPSMPKPSSGSRTTSSTMCTCCNGAIAISIFARSTPCARASRHCPRIEGLTRAQAGARCQRARQLWRAMRASSRLAQFGPRSVERLWEVCQIPDYRNISASEHADLVGRIFEFLMQRQRPHSRRLVRPPARHCDRSEGDIDTLVEPHLAISAPGLSSPTVPIGSKRRCSGSRAPAKSRTNYRTPCMKG